MILPVLFSLAAQAAVPFCETSKEFITTFEFLKKKQIYYRSGDQALATAKKVASGCTGAANRFIRTIKILEKTDLTSGEVLSLAEGAAIRNDEVAEAFLKIYAILFASDGYDLDQNTAMTLARKLSIDYAGDVKMAMKDFEKISEFCQEKEPMKFGKSQCASVAQKFAVVSDKAGMPVADKFISTLQFLVSKNGPALTTKDSLDLLHELMSRHPQAVVNFRSAYEYAVSEKGLGAHQAEAIKFAKFLASQTLEKP
jgi:hypothetical protein